MPLAERKKRWTEDPGLNDLSQFLTHAKTSLGVDILFLINAGGDCIAASNWDAPESTIGTNFVDRDYFRKNINGQSWMQYAVGKTTGIPGLYFSSPIFVNGQFSGAVVAKIDVPNLSFLIKELDAFVTDENGVIVLARNKRLEMFSLPGASIAQMTEQKKLARYRRSSFPILQMEPWGNNEFPALMRIQNEQIPQIFISDNISEYSLTVHVGEGVSDIGVFDHDESWFTFLLGISGSVLILIAGGTVLYWSSVKSERVALERANEAERRIIGISEDTQQRIGRELHDDLGQHLTGIAFMSEVLYKKLQKQDSPSIKEASKITLLINEAISKTRLLAQGLYPVELKEAGLPAMLERIAKRIGEIYKIDCVFMGDNECNVADSLAAINLYRIAQEAVNNAVKHSGASRITLKLTSESGVVILEIIDNGCGIGNVPREKGIGMRSMLYRASLLGATLNIGSPPSGGTSITVNFPVK